MLLFEITFNFIFLSDCISQICSKHVILAIKNIEYYILKNIDMF